MFLKGRSIVVDWAIPKNKYETIHTNNKNEENNTIKEENSAVDVKVENEIKEEVLSDNQEYTEEKPLMTLDDYLTLDITKIENENLVDFETTDE